LKQSQGEIGYGYWLRYMSYYPATLSRLPEHFFISRLTDNNKYSDSSRIGDRKLLVLFSPENFFTFATYDLADKNPNVFQRVPVPEYFESTWAFLYFSYSVEQRRAEAFLKIEGEAQLRTAEFSVTHMETDFARFIFGGKEVTQRSHLFLLVRVFWFQWSASQHRLWLRQRQVRCHIRKILLPY
jgi:hypothetical protein